jgi:hypothetical protein
MINYTGRKGIKTTYFSHEKKNTKKIRRKITRKKYRAGEKILNKKDILENTKT